MPLTAQANTGSGTDVLNTDLIAGQHIPGTKLVVGAAGVNGGYVDGSNPLPVALSGSSNQTVNPGANVAVNITTNGNTTVTSPLAAGLAPSEAILTVTSVPTGFINLSTTGGGGGDVYRAFRSDGAQFATSINVIGTYRIPLAGVNSFVIQASGISAGAFIADVRFNYGSPSSQYVYEENCRLINNKTPSLGLATPASSSPVVLPTIFTVTGPVSQSAANTNLLDGVVNGWTDVSAFRSGSVQLIGSAGITAGNVIIEHANINSGAGVSLVAVNESILGNTRAVVGAQNVSASTTIILSFPIVAQFIRIRIVTAFTGGTVQAVAAFSQASLSSALQTIIASNAVTTSVSSTNVAGTALIGDVGLQVRANATGAASVVKVQTAATTNAAVVKASAGRVLGWQLTNTAAAPRVVRLSNIATAPVPGTTVPLLNLVIPAGQTIDSDSDIGIAFTVGIGISVTAGLTDLDSTVTAVNDVIGHVRFA